MIGSEAEVHEEHKFPLCTCSKFAQDVCAPLKLLHQTSGALTDSIQKSFILSKLFYRARLVKYVTIHIFKPLIHSWHLQTFTTTLHKRLWMPLSKYYLFWNWYRKQWQICYLLKVLSSGELICGIHNEQQTLIELMIN